MDILSMDKVNLSYYTSDGETTALKDISFTAKAGEFIAIVGPSGCGKTTILSLISGLIQPNNGTILIRDNAVNGPSTNVGYMLQRDQLFEWRNIEKNVRLGLEISAKLTKENIAYTDNLLDKYGLNEFRKHYPNQLSGGMRQRVALIRTLAFRPDILLLDEPFSALDYQTRLAVCDDVYNIIKCEHKTAVLVTHDISEAVSLADRIIVLSSRPAIIKSIHTVTIDKPTPLSRREDSGFPKLFDIIYKELNTDEKV